MDNNVRAGDIVTMGKDGVWRKWRHYTRQERIIRWLGRILHIRRLTHWHERVPMGVAFGDRGVMTKGTFLMRYP